MMIDFPYLPKEIIDHVAGYIKCPFELPQHEQNRILVVNSCTSWVLSLRTKGKADYSEQIDFVTRHEVQRKRDSSHCGPCQV